MALLSSEQVLALAPDSASASAGKTLANTRKWVTLGANESAVWGECQGSGSKPYQTQVDCADMVSKCSCPSRKFPCKHGLGLLLLRATQAEAFTQTEPPAWVSEWLASRGAKKQVAQEKKAEVAQKEADPDANLKRAAAREKKVAGGIGELDKWLFDIARDGLAAAQSRPYAFWDGMASHLVDAQCAGLARRVREVGGIAAAGGDWQNEMLRRLSLLHLAVEAHGRADKLPAPLRDELRGVIGWTLKEDELLASGALVEDEWLVLGLNVTLEDRIQTARTWLWGVDAARPALHLAFAHASQTLPPALVPGTRLRASGVFYPGSLPLRLVWKDKAAPGALQSVPATSIEGALNGFARALGHNPWLENWLFVLDAALPLFEDGVWRVRDAAGDELPLRLESRAGWKLLALTGGTPGTLCGEWNGHQLRPLGLWNGEKYEVLA